MKFPEPIPFEKGTRPFAGVYFLFANDELVYVGQSTNVFARIETHANSLIEQKEFDSYAWEKIEDYKDRLTREAAVMIECRPRLNKVEHAMKVSPAWLRDAMQWSVPA